MRTAYVSMAKSEHSKKLHGLNFDRLNRLEVRERLRHWLLKPEVVVTGNAPRVKRLTICFTFTRPVLICFTFFAKIAKIEESILHVGATLGRLWP